MGHHYTPNIHLQRFGTKANRERIWMFNTETHQFVQLPCNRVAQSPNFYPDDVEIKLNYQIEIPGNEGIKKLLRFESLEPEERKSVAAHMIVMSSRGPRQRRKNRDVMPDVFADTANRVKQRLNELYEGEAERNQKLLELEELTMSWLEQPPAHVEHLLKTPFISPKTVELIYNMSWELVPAPGDRYYVTSDTPAHYFEGMGMAKHEAEFTMTLSSEFALVAHHQGQQQSLRFREKAERKLTDELNRRILDTTEKFVFSSEPGDWIKNSSKKKLHLNIIRWEPSRRIYA